MPGLSSETARAVLRPVTRQFRRLTLRVAGEFSRLTSVQCLCLQRRLVSPPAGDSTRLDSTRRVRLVRPHVPFPLFARAFLRFCIPPRPLPRQRQATFVVRPPDCGKHTSSCTCQEPKGTPKVWFSWSAADWYVRSPSAAFVTLSRNHGNGCFLFSYEYLILVSLGSLPPARQRRASEFLNDGVVYCGVAMR